MRGPGRPRLARDSAALGAMSELRQERGLLTRIAVGLGLTVQAVHGWPVVPLERVVEVERITGVPREELRQDFHLRRRAA